MKICNGCGGVLGRDCWNEQDCVAISNSQDNQFISQLESELRWERDVVVPDLEQKLSNALYLIFDLCRIAGKTKLEQPDADNLKTALQFYDEHKQYKIDNKADNNSDDGLPF